MVRCECVLNSLRLHNAASCQNALTPRHDADMLDTSFSVLNVFHGGNKAQYQVSKQQQQQQQQQQHQCVYRVGASAAWYRLDDASLRLEDDSNR